MLLSISSQYGDWVEQELKEWISNLDDNLRESIRLTEEELNLIQVPHVDFQDEKDTRGNRAGNVSKSKMVVSIGKMSELIDYDTVEQCCLKISKRFESLDRFCEWLITTL